MIEVSISLSSVATCLSSEARSQVESCISLLGQASERLHPAFHNLCHSLVDLDEGGQLLRGAMDSIEQEIDDIEVFVNDAASCLGLHGVWYYAVRDTLIGRVDWLRHRYALAKEAVERGENPWALPPRLVPGMASYGAQLLDAGRELRESIGVCLSFLRALLGRY